MFQAKYKPAINTMKKNSDSDSLAPSSENLSEAMSGHVTSEGLKKKGKIFFLKKILLQKKDDTDKLLNVKPDTDFELVNIQQSDVDKVAAPLNGPVNLRKPFDYKRWVTNSERIDVYRQDQRSLHEIIEAGGFLFQNARGWYSGGSCARFEKRVFICINL
ncbi:Uncharacterised protein [Serratia odorifera]|uniref:Uncharacterized protein n=1 Tax=Serratia odorifera TaxID=618 RepID=A0A447KKJ0_SEROD|nr:hypothetical protein [Serratia odorifera]VDZ51445.1 Uncharacterised protein [Serratia odorifera]